MNDIDKVDFIRHCFDKILSDNFYLNALESKCFLNQIELEFYGIPEFDEFLIKFFPNITPMQYSIIKRESWGIYTEEDTRYLSEGEIKYTKYKYICDFANLYDALEKVNAPIIKTAILK